jgi:ABC-2 type transport system ATP-binding protein
MRLLVKQLGQQHTVILSSHILAEVEQICGDLVIIAGGKLVAHGTPAELRERVTGTRVIAEMRGAEPDQMSKALSGLEGVVEVQAAKAGNWVRLMVKGKPDTDPRAAVAALAAQKGYQLRELRREVSSLEDFFVQITYRQNIGWMPTETPAETAAQ